MLNLLEKEHAKVDIYGGNTTKKLGVIINKYCSKNVVIITIFVNTPMAVN